jgi:hypothetical protein
MEEGELEEAEMEEGYDKNMEEAEGDDMLNSILKT